MKNNLSYCFKTFYLSLLFILIVSLIGAGQETSVTEQDEIDGVYEFVSQQTIITEPNQGTRSLSAPDWVGTWHFSQGSFSTILMRKKRTKFAIREKYDEDYDSFGGIYSVENQTLTLIPLFALRPGNQDQSIRLKFQIKENTLILTQYLNPFIEDMRRGAIVTTLRKRAMRRK